MQASAYIVWTCRVLELQMTLKSVFRFPCCTFAKINWRSIFHKQMQVWSDRTLKMGTLCLRLLPRRWRGKRIQQFHRKNIKKCFDFTPINLSDVRKTRSNEKCCNRADIKSKIIGLLFGPQKRWEECNGAIYTHEKNMKKSSAQREHKIEARCPAEMIIRKGASVNTLQDESFGFQFQEKNRR